MKRMSVAGALTAALSVVFSVSLLMAQEAPQMPVPQKEHEWLRQFVGEWESEAEAIMEPGQPPIKCKSTMHTRMLGGFWVVSEVKQVESDMSGVNMQALQTIGYDPQKKKYVGTWVDSMVGHMWKYEGSTDPTGKILTLEAEGPNFMLGGKLTKFRDSYEFKSADHIVATSSILGEDGKWFTFMTGQVTRKNKK